MSKIVLSFVCLLFIMMVACDRSANDEIVCSQFSYSIGIGSSGYISSGTDAPRIYELKEMIENNLGKANIQIVGKNYYNIIFIGQGVDMKSAIANADEKAIYFYDTIAELLYSEIKRSKEQFRKRKLEYALEIKLESNRRIIDLDIYTLVFRNGSLSEDIITLKQGEVIKFYVKGGDVYLK